MATILNLAVLMAIVLLLGRFMPGVRVKNWTSAAAVAVVFSALNWALGWFISAVLFVPAILTLGLLFLFVPFIVNTVVLWLTDKFLDAFELRDARALLLSSAAITLVGGAFRLFIAR